ncbi:MAG: metallophosphoesterase [Planctomycetota bacterium]|nr:metallophosphoesterase [Planctomycetota bacterium]
MTPNESPKPTEVQGPASPPRRRLTRRAILKYGAVLAVAGAGAAYARWIEPEWIEVTRHDLPVPHLPAAWDGARVALIADLHHCAWVPLDYLARAIEQVKALEPDLVAVAGDLILSNIPANAERVAGLFAGLRPPHGVFACLGNHDYGLTRPVYGRVVPDLGVAENLTKNGVRVLRNEAVQLTRSGQALWVAGVEDFWTSRCLPRLAMRDVPAGAANLVLCHNPDAADELAAAGCGPILAGHTHGGQVCIPFIGPVLLPVENRTRDQGLHTVGRTCVYVTRGIGWTRRVRFACRPEISLLTLRPAPG